MDSDKLVSAIAEAVMQTIEREQGIIKAQIEDAVRKEIMAFTPIETMQRKDMSHYWVDEAANFVPFPNSRDQEIIEQAPIKPYDAQWLHRYMAAKKPEPKGATTE